MLQLASRIFQLFGEEQAASFRPRSDQRSLRRGGRTRRLDHNPTMRANQADWDAAAGKVPAGKVASEPAKSDLGAGSWETQSMASGEGTSLRMDFGTVDGRGRVAFLGASRAAI
jgi:hypothetical protein